MANSEEIEKLRASLKEAEHVQSELDRRIFHLKTLYDVSKDIYSSVETETILRNFLLMIMGNFGVMEGFIILLDASSKEISQLVSIGMQDGDIDALRQDVIELLSQKGLMLWTDEGASLQNAGLVPGSFGFSMGFRVEYECLALLGLGTKLIK